MLKISGIVFLLLFSLTGNAQSGDMLFTSAGTGYFAGRLVPAGTGYMHFEPASNPNGIVFTKLDNAGNFVWQKQHSTSVSFPQQAFLMLPDSSMLIAGAQFNQSFILIAFFDSQGDLVWAKQYASGGGGTVVKDIVQLSPSRFMLLGSQSNSLQVGGLLFMKFDINGINEPAVIQDFPGNTSMTMMSAMMNNNNEIVWVAEASGGSYFGIADTNAVQLHTIKYTTGVMTGFDFRELIQSPNDEYYALGSGQNYEDIYLFHMDSLGHVIHKIAFEIGSMWWSRGKDICLAPNGSLYLLAEGSVSNSAYDACVMHFDDTLGVLSSYQFVGYGPNGIVIRNGFPLFAFYGYDQNLLDDARIYSQLDSNGSPTCNAMVATLNQMPNATMFDTAFVLTYTPLTLFAATATTLISTSCAVTSSYPYCLFNPVEEISSYVPASVFPNPATEQINIQIAGADLDEYQIVNPLGEIVSIGNTSSNSSISISSLPSDAYLIMLYEDQKLVQSFRFIKN